MEPAIERIRTHIERLVDVIGPRVMGSIEDQQAMDYIAGELRSYGLEPIYHRIECPCWQHRDTRLTLAATGEALAAQGCQFSVPCDVLGDVVVIGDITSANNAPVAGKICLLSADVGAAIGGDVTGRNLLALALEARGAMALVVDRGHADPYAYDGKYIREPDLRVMPVACVSRRVAERIRSTDSPLRLTIDASYWQGHTYNIEAVIPGKGEGCTFVTAHHDTGAGSPGGNDDGASVAIALEMARIFSRQEPACELRVCLIGAHERLGQGNSHYDQNRVTQVQSRLVDLVLDGLGAGNGPSAAVVDAPDTMIELLKQVLACHGEWKVTCQERRRRASDEAGSGRMPVPHIWMNNMPEEPVHVLHHTQFDDLAHLDMALVERGAGAVADLIRCGLCRA